MFNQERLNQELKLFHRGEATQEGLEYAAFLVEHGYSYIYAATELVACGQTTQYDEFESYD